MSEIAVNLNHAALDIDLQRATLQINLGGIGPPGPPGSAGAQTAIHPAGEQIFAGRAVIVDAGKLWHFQPSNLDHVGRFYGIAITSGAINASVTVQTAGECYDAGFFTFTADTVLWVGPNGVIQNTIPPNRILQKAGVAIGDQKLRIDGSYTGVRAAT